MQEFVGAAQRARAGVGGETLDLNVAALKIRVHLIGSRVSPVLGRGLLGDEPDSSAVDSEIYAFDTAESGVAPPPPPWPASAFEGRREEIPGFIDPPRLAIYNLEHATLSFYDETASAGVQWFRDAAKMMPGEGGSPLRNLLRWAFGQHDAHMLHLAAAGGVLLGGPGGAGKSTSSLAFALAGAPFTSDDFTVVTLDGGPCAHATYSCVKVTDSTLELLPALADVGRPAGRDWRQKLRFDLSQTIVRSQAIHAIVLPELADATGRPRELAPAEALRRLTGGSLMVMTGAMGRSLGALNALLEALPVYRLEVGPDIERVPEAIASLAAVGSAR